MVFIGELDWGWMVLGVCLISFFVVGWNFAYYLGFVSLGGWLKFFVFKGFFFVVFYLCVVVGEFRVMDFGL